MKLWLAVLLGKFLRLSIRIIRKGGGSALPGAVIDKIFPNLLPQTLSKFEDGLVIVTGSAGKSTTTKMLTKIMEAHGLEVFTNPSTANINQGLISTIIERTPVFGRTPGRIAILEVDEAHADVLSKIIPPRLVSILNVMEDQLDRFQDPSFVRQHLLNAASQSTEHVVLNGDDPNLRLLAEELDQVELSWFGISPDIVAKQKRGLLFSPVHRKVPARSAVAVEVLSYKDGEFRVALDSGISGDVVLPSRGLHYASDAACAITTARLLLGESFSFSKTLLSLNNTAPVFARGELTSVRGQLVEFILVQNPGSMQLNLDNLASAPDQLFFAIGRDVHDPSWLWSVDFSKLSHVDVVSGFNAAEAELVLVYNNIPVAFSTDDLELALNKFFELPPPKTGVKTIIFSADAMRRIRRILGFWAPEEVGH